MLTGGREGGAARWHCYSVVVKEGNGGSKYTFPCKKWVTVSDAMDISDAVLLTCDDDKTEEGKLTVTRSKYYQKMCDFYSFIVLGSVL